MIFELKTSGRTGNRTEPCVDQYIGQCFQKFGDVRRSRLLQKRFCRDQLILVYKFSLVKCEEKKTHTKLKCENSD